MKAKDVMTRDVVRVDKDERLTTVLDLMRKENVSKLPVTHDGKLVGLILDGDVADELGALKHRGVRPSQLHATTAMRRSFPKADPDTDLARIHALMLEHDVHLVPIVNGDSLVGVVTASDLLQHVRDDAPVSQIMTPHVVAVSPTDRVIHARRLMIDHAVERLPVLDGGRLVGIVGERDVALGFASLKDSVPDHRQSSRLQQFLVEGIMQRRVVTVDATATATDAAQRMRAEDVGALPVVRSERVVGIVTRTDLLKRLRL